MTCHIILDPYVVIRRSRQDLGIGSWAAVLSRRQPYHWTGGWVDARATWVGNLPAKVLVGDINGRSGSKFAGCKMATIDFVLEYNVAKQKEIHL